MNKPFNIYDHINVVHWQDTWSWEELLAQAKEKVEFIVDGLIPQRGVTLITGEGGIGKSFMLLELAYSVATGTPFLGKFPCKQGSVLYLDLENDEATIARRAQKILTAHTIEADNTTSTPVVSPSPTLPLAPSPAPGVRANPQSTTSPSPVPIRFMRKWKLASANLYINEDEGREIIYNIINKYKPMLTLIDPLTAFHSTDENDNVAIRRIIALLQDIARGMNGAVVMVHHPRKRGMINDPGQMIRGASDLRNAVDSHLFIRKLGGNQILMEHDKSRHSPELPSFRVEIKDNPEETATYIRYLERKPVENTKVAMAKEGILSILRENGPSRLKDIVDELRKNDISESTSQFAIRDLYAKETIIKSARGAYALPENLPDENL